MSASAVYLFKSIRRVRPRAGAAPPNGIHTHAARAEKYTGRSRVCVACVGYHVSLVDNRSGDSQVAATRSLRPIPDCIRAVPVLASPTMACAIEEHCTIRRRPGSRNQCVPNSRSVPPRKQNTKKRVLARTRYAQTGGQIDARHIDYVFYFRKIINLQKLLTIQLY